MRRGFFAALALCCLVAAPQGAAAQVRLKEAHRNEICVSYGVSLLGLSVGTVSGFANILGAIGDEMSSTSGDHIRVRISGSHGIATLGYSYTLNTTWQFGAAGGYSRLAMHLSDNTGSFRPLTADMYNFMNTAQVNWFRTGNDVFGMYTKMAVGMWIVNYGLMVDTADEKRGTKTFYPIGQISAVCLEVGRQFSGFLELGVGMQGSIVTGIRARF